MINLVKESTPKAATRFNLEKDERKPRKVTIRRKISDFVKEEENGVGVVDVNALFSSLRPEVLLKEIKAKRG